MRRARLSHRGPLLAGLTALLALGAVCSPSSALWFGLGTLFSSQFRTTTVEYRCFRDGVPVDCSELPGFQP